MTRHAKTLAAAFSARLMSRAEDRDAALLALGFVFLCAAFFSERYDGSAFTYAVVAEFGGFKFQQLAHPLYVPSLRAIQGAARLAGGSGRMLGLFQWASLLASGLTLWLYARLAGRLTQDRVAAIAAAVLFAAGHEFWYFSMQAKPYAGATLCLVWFFSLFCDPHSPNPRRAGWMGIAAALCAGFTLMGLALCPLGLWAAAREGPRAERARRVIVFACALAAVPAILASAAAVHRGVHMPIDISARELLARAAPGASLFDGRTLARQVGAFKFRFTTMEFELSVWSALMLGCLAPGGIRRLRQGGPFLIRALWVSAGLAALFFIVMNDFFYCIFFAAPLAAAVSLKGWAPARWLLAAAAACVAGHSFLATIHPASRGEDELFRIEGRFLSRVSRPADMILGAGPADWRLLYFFGQDLPLFEMIFDDSSKGLLLHARPVNAGPETVALIGATLRRGGSVFLAADNFFMSKSSAENEARRQAVQDLLLRHFSLGAPLISPSAQYYYPIVSIPRPSATLSP